MNSLVLSGTPGKGGPSESEESKEEVTSSLCKNWRLESSQNMVIGGKEEKLTSSGVRLPEGRQKDLRRSACCTPLL